MELHKVIAKRRPHYYESKKSFDRGVKYHVAWLDQVKDYMPHLVVHTFQIDYNLIDGFHWRFIKTYQVIKGKVV